MDKNVILLKTDKGIDEIKIRQYKLNPRLRAILIVVNGQKNIGELLNNFSQIDNVDDDVRSSIKTGFLRATADFKKQRKALSNSVTDVMGPYADFFTLQIEECKDIGALTKFIDDKRAMLERGMGSRGKAFWGLAKDLAR